MHYILIASNILISIIYTLYNRKMKKTWNIPRFLLCVFVPFYGVLLFIAVDFLIKNKFMIENSIYETDADEQDIDDIISDISNVDYSNTLPIVDVLEIKDIKKKRKFAFKSVKGDFRKIYPFLEKIVQDDDPEVVHYASTAISDYRQKINENYSKMREMYIESSQNIKNCENYLRAFLDLIYWEEFNNSNTIQKRIEISELFNSYFSSAQNIDKYYYVQKIKNEIKIKNFREADKSCNKFEKAYPNSYKTYLSRLEFYYFSENKEGFLDTLEKIKYKDIVLSKQAHDIVLFWNNSLKHEFRGAV